MLCWRDTGWEYLHMQVRQIIARWLGVESRADATDTVIKAILERANGNQTTGKTGSEEYAAGMWARALSSARVTPETQITETLTPAVMAQIGRGLIHRGETLHEIRVDDLGRVQLVQAAHWEVTSAADGSWCMLPNSGHRRTVW